MLTFLNSVQSLITLEKFFKLQLCIYNAHQILRENFSHIKKLCDNNLMLSYIIFV